MRGRPVHETPRWKESPRGCRSRPIPRGGREATGPRPTPSLARGTHRVLARSEDNRMWNPLRFRADRRPKDYTKTPRGRAGKNAPKSPTVLIPSFEIRSSDPDPTGVTPSWRNTDQISKADFVTIEWEKNTLDPQGDPIAKQLRIDEWKKPSFRSSAQKCATRPDTDDPIAKARHQPLGKVREESSFRSRSETNSTRQGDLIAKTPTKHQEGGGRDFVPIED